MVRQFFFAVHALHFVIFFLSVKWSHTSDILCLSRMVLGSPPSRKLNCERSEVCPQ